MLAKEYDNEQARFQFIANFQTVTQKHFLFPNPDEQVFLTKSDPSPTSSGKYFQMGWLPKKWIANDSPLLASVDPKLVCGNASAPKCSEVIILSLGPLSTSAHLLLNTLAYSELSSISTSLEDLCELYTFAKKNKLNSEITKPLERHLLDKTNSLDELKIQKSIPILRMFIQLGGKRSDDPVVKKLIPSFGYLEGPEFIKTCVSLAFEGQEIEKSKIVNIQCFIKELSRTPWEDDDDSWTTPLEDLEYIQNFANCDNAGTKITTKDARVILHLLKCFDQNDNSNEIEILVALFPELDKECT